MAGAKTGKELADTIVESPLFVVRDAVRKLKEAGVDLAAVAAAMDEDEGDGDEEEGN